MSLKSCRLHINNQTQITQITNITHNIIKKSKKNEKPENHQTLGEIKRDYKLCCGWNPDWVKKQWLPHRPCSVKTELTKIYQLHNTQKGNWPLKPYTIQIVVQRQYNVRYKWKKVWHLLDGKDYNIHTGRQSINKTFSSPTCFKC